MTRTVSIGTEAFCELRENDAFFVDKTGFIKEWWNGGAKVTLITRPRRFGKTLTMSMVECFFSTGFAGRSDLFEGLEIWEDEELRKLQGTLPVINLSLKNAKAGDYPAMAEAVGTVIYNAYDKHRELLESESLADEQKEFSQKILLSRGRVGTAEIRTAVTFLLQYLHKHYGVKPILLIDEYDTPLLSAYLNGYFTEAAELVRGIFSGALKTNDSLGRAILTGITRISKESLFSDLNNLSVAGMLDNAYGDSFGFTEREVMDALDEFGLSGEPEIKVKFEKLLRGESIAADVSENVVFQELNQADNEAAVWTLLLFTGYLRTDDIYYGEYGNATGYTLKITNMEIMEAMKKLVISWFRDRTRIYNKFVQSLLENNVEEMNIYLSGVLENCMSYHDGGKSRGEERIDRPESRTPENFYHGLVLGMLVDLQGRYDLTSNRESGYGRYDIMLEPLAKADDRTDMPAYIIEFKVLNGAKEKNLEETADSALKQIEEKAYETALLAKGIAKGKVHKYGMAFNGKEVLVKPAVD